MIACCTDSHRWTVTAVAKALKREHLECCSGHYCAGRAVSATCGNTISSGDPSADGTEVCFLEL